MAPVGGGTGRGGAAGLGPTLEEEGIGADAGILEDGAGALAVLLREEVVLVPREARVEEAVAGPRRGVVGPSGQARCPRPTRLRCDARVSG